MTSSKSYKDEKTNTFAIEKTKNSQKVKSKKGICLLNRR